MAPFKYYLLLPNGDYLLTPNADRLIFSFGGDEVTYPRVRAGTELERAAIEIRGPDNEPLVQKVAPLKLETRSEWASTGGWTIELPTFDFDGGLSLAAQAISIPGAGIRVFDRDTNETLFSGPTHLTNGGTQVAATRTVQNDANGNKTDVLVVSGPDDLGVLNERLAEPEPDFSGTDASDKRTGAASSVVLQYLNLNAGPGAMAGRALPGYQFAADPVAGATITGEARWDKLLDLVKRLCRRGGITVEAVQVGRQIVVTVKATADMSDNVLFSVEAGTLSQAIIDSSITQGTYFVVAGKGEGAARNIQRVNTPLTPVRRIEQFLDQRNISDAAGLIAQGNDAVVAQAGTISLTLKPNVTDAARLGEDFHLGDIVAVEVTNLDTLQQDRRKERVIAVTKTYTPDDIQTDITIGATQPFGTLAFIKSIQDVQAQLSVIQKI